MTRPPVLFTSLFLFGALALVRPQGAAAPAQASAAIEVPIGGIILWWGRAADIPPGFEACDGTAVTTKDAVLRGAKPDLQNKFARGAANYRSFVPQAYAGGGSDAIKLDGNAVKVGIEDHKLTAAQLPAHTHLTPLLTHNVNDHSHSINGHHHAMDHTHLGGEHTHGGIQSVASAETAIDLNGTPDGDPYLVSSTGSTTGPVTVKPTPFTTGASSRADTADTPLTTSVTNGSPAANHLPTQTDSTGAVGQILLKHELSVSTTTLDNRPAYLEVVFLIRVK